MFELFESFLAAAVFVSHDGKCSLYELQSMGSMASLADDRNVTIYNDQPVEFAFLSMKDMVFSASDIQELKMVMVRTNVVVAV